MEGRIWARVFVGREQMERRGVLGRRAQERKLRGWVIQDCETRYEERWGPKRAGRNWNGGAGI
eukprot:180086-Pyramimonas_sp.AAC.1